MVKIVNLQPSKNAISITQSVCFVYYAPAINEGMLGVRISAINEGMLGVHISTAYIIYIYFKSNSFEILSQQR